MPRGGNTHSPEMWVINNGAGLQKYGSSVSSIFRNGVGLFGVASGARLLLKNLSLALSAFLSLVTERNFNVLSHFEAAWGQWLVLA